MIIILDDLDFGWEKRKIKQVIRLWEKGLHIQDIAKIIKPKSPVETREDETALLIMHLCRQNLIKPRGGGVYGKGGCQ